MKFFLSVIAVILAVLALGFVQQAEAATYDPSKPYYIQHVASGMVLDVRNSNTKAGTPVIFMPYTGQNNQLWNFKDNKFHSLLGGFVLNVVDGRAHDYLTVEPSRNVRNQFWIIPNTGVIASAFQGEVMGNVFGTYSKMSKGNVVLAVKLGEKPEYINRVQKFSVLPKKI